MGAQLNHVPTKPVDAWKENSRFVAAFAGNLGNWYGKMLEQLVTKALTAQAPVDFRFYGGGASWSGEFDRLARERGMLRGHVPFEQLRREMAEADGLLLPMGFGEDCALTERTSFKTKFLDYLTFEKPILVWGPEYCSAVRFAREFDSAEICASADERKFLATIEALGANPARQSELVRNARRMYDDRFHPDKIHGVLVEQCRRLMQTRIHGAA
jgi:hypothetical protein